MIPALQTSGLKDEEFETINHISDHLKKHPALNFRQSENRRFLFELDDHYVRRLEFQPLALSTEKDFNDYNSGQMHHFDAVFLALLILKGTVFHSVETTRRPKLDFASNK